MNFVIYISKFKKKSGYTGRKEALADAICEMRIAKAYIIRMILNEYSISSETGTGALLRLFNSQPSFKKRPPGNHHHSMIEISLIKSGSGVYTVGDRSYDIAPGDVFTFTSDEPHCITEISDSDMLIMNLQFEPRFIWAPGNGMFDAKYLRVFLDREKGHSNRLDRSSGATAEIAELLLSMEREFEAAEPEYELIVKIRLLTVLVLLARTGGISTDDFITQDNPNLVAMNSVMEYINANLASKLSLEELAKKASMSRSYFSTIFKDLNGVTPWEYIMVKRVEKAITMLNRDGASIIEIAGACGFNSTANFNRAFRKITGRTPSSYRRLDS